MTSAPVVSIPLEGHREVSGLVHVVSGHVSVRFSSTGTCQLNSGDTILLKRSGQAYSRSARLLLFSDETDPGVHGILRGDPDLIETADRILIITRSEGVLRSRVLSAAAACFSSLATMKATTASPEIADDWIEMGRQLIENQALTAVPLKRLLGDIPYSYEHFLRLFKARHGQTPREYRERQRLARARRLLAEEKQSITRMAYALGYSSSQHFATNFKKQIGLTPREYRAATVPEN